MNNELVKAVGKSLMQGVGLNLVLTLSWCELFPGDKKLGRDTILGADIKPFFTPTKTYSLLILLICESPRLRCGGISSCVLPFLLGIILNSCGPHFPLHSQAGFPHLLFSYILNPSPPTTLPTPSSHLPSPLPAISLLARPAADWLFPARAQ